jgi:hypothetical protein
VGSECQTHATGLMPAAANDTVVLIVGLRDHHSPFVLTECDRFKGRNLKIMTLQLGASARRLFIGCILQLGLIFALAVWSGASMAEKLVDPNSVSPEYRAAAEKRRAEQIKLLECSKKADAAKVPRRDRAAYVNECLEK